MGAALLVGRTALAAVFAVAAVAKLVDLPGSRRAVEGFGIPARLARPLGVVVPLLELVAAGLLVPSVTAGFGALVALVLVGAFCVAIAVALARGERPDCHCFGQLHSAPIGWGTVARNLTLAAAAALMLGAQAHALAFVYMAVALAVGAAAAFAVDRLRPSDRQRGREVFDQALPEGSTAPPFELPSLEGTRVSLGSLLARGRPLLLVFSDAFCGPCQELAPEIAHWQREHADELTIAVLERARDDAAGADEHGRRDVLLQLGSEVADAYGARGTPTAVLIDANARIASPVAGGTPAIEALLAERLESFEPRLPQPAPQQGAREPALRITGVPASNPQPAFLAPIRRREALARLGSALAALTATLALPEWALARKHHRHRHPKCDRGEIYCESAGQCVDPALLNGFCGGCPGHGGKVCPDGTACINGHCTDGNFHGCFTPPYPGYGCGPNNKVCCLDSNNRTDCVDIQEDPKNCGGCGIHCDAPNTCCKGRGCRDLSSDPQACGDCFKRCEPGQLCYNGKCIDKCPRGLRKCGSTCGSPRTQHCCGGKLIDNDKLQFDDNNCGTCGNSCKPSPGVRRPACCGGECVDLATRPAHCGACFHQCPAGTVCNGGSCS